MRIDLLTIVGYGQQEATKPAGPGSGAKVCQLAGAATVRSFVSFHQVRGLQAYYGVKGFESLKRLGAPDKLLSRAGAQLVPLQFVGLMTEVVSLNRIGDRIVAGK